MKISILSHTLAAAGCIVLLGPIAPGAAAQPASRPTALVAAGHDLFKSRGCYECHGYVGQGSLTTGPALAPLRLPLEGVRAYVRHPAGQMPPYSASLLPDSEVEAIVAYLKALKSPPAESIGPLKRFITEPSN